MKKDFNASMIMNALKIGTFLGFLSETFINVAMSKFMDIFQVNANAVQWLTAGYMLVMGTFVPLTAFLIQRVTTRKLFLSAMTIFLVGTILAASAQSFLILLISRLIQAIGTSVLLPLMMNTVMILNPPEKRGSAMGSALLIVLFAPAIGPTYGGLIIQTISWRWIFISIIPFVIITIIFGFIFLKNITETIKIKLDSASLIMSILGFGGVIYGLDSFFAQDSSYMLDRVILLVGIVSLIVFALRQLKIPNPLLNVRVFSYPIFSLGIILITFTYMILFANFILMPMFLEKVLGFTTTQSGLAVLPGGIIGAILPSVFGKIYDRFGPKVIVPLGFGIMTAANFAISQMTSSTNTVLPIILYCCVITGMGTLLTASQTNTLNQLPKEYYSHGTAMMNTMMLIGSAMGSSLFVGIMALKQKQCIANNFTLIQSLNSGINLSYAFVAGLAALGFVLSLFFQKKNVKQNK